MQSQPHIAGLWFDILYKALGSDPSSRIVAFYVNEKSHTQGASLSETNLDLLALCASLDRSVPSPVERI